MRLILALFPVLLLVQDGFGHAVSLGSHFSGKNLLIMVALLLVFLRIGREGRARVELPAIQICFALLVGYAILTWWVASFIIRYERYPVWENLVSLKIFLLDYFLIFLAFFYGPQKESEIASVLVALLAVVAITQIFTVGEWSGILPTSFVTVDYTGRYNGLIAQVNEFALFTSLFMPSFVAMALWRRGVSRVLWFALAILCVVSLAVTVSRAAILGVLVAGGFWLYYFRAQLSTKVTRKAVAIAVVVLAVIGIGLSFTRHGPVLYERLVVDTFQQTSVGDVSKGRTDVWKLAVDRMLDQPITLLTGYGWRVYWSLPHMLSPHNYYLEMWFNLGLLGLACIVAIFAICIVSARRATESARGFVKLQLFAAVFGLFAVSVGLFFSTWSTPWPYFWAYVGLSMRMVVLSGEQKSAKSVVSAGNGGDVAVREVRDRRDQFGWLRKRPGQVDKREPDFTGRVTGELLGRPLPEGGRRQNES
jgi:O-antigen ligase